MLEIGEISKTGPWTTFKFLMMASVLKEAEDTSIDTKHMIILMEAVKTVAKALGLKLLLPRRSREKTYQGCIGIARVNAKKWMYRV